MVSPEISVVMAVYNGEEYLKEAVDSILCQTVSDFEFIIVDDGSTDASSSIVRSFKDPRIKLIEQSNQGLAKALNNGIAYAKGKYIARLDADDIALPERLELQRNFLESNPAAVIVGSNAIVMDKEGCELYTSSQKLTWEEIKTMLPDTPFYHSAVFFRKDTFIKAGGYYEAIRHHFEDVILWNRMAEYGELFNLKETLIKYRIVPGGISNRTVKTGKIMAMLYRNILKNNGLSAKEEALLKKITIARSRNWKYSNYYLNIAKIYLERNLDRNNSRKNIYKAIRHNVLNYIAWFNLFLLLFPVSYIRKWKNHRGIEMPERININA